jgi:competence protein ComEA
MRPEPSRPPWGWNLPARGLLALLSIAGSLRLLAVAPGDDPGPRDVPRMIVDPNTASAAVLSALPRLGPALVGRIAAARVLEPFQSLEDLEVRVRGIGPATAEALREHLRFDAEPAPAEDVPLPSSPIVQNAP